MDAAGEDLDLRLPKPKSGDALPRVSHRLWGRRQGRDSGTQAEELLDVGGKAGRVRHHF